MENETRLTVDVPAADKQLAEERLAKFSPPLSLSAAVRTGPWAELLADLRAGKFSLVLTQSDDAPVMVPMSAYVERADKDYVQAELGKADPPVSLKAALAPYWSKFVDALRSGTLEITTTIPQETPPG